MRAATISANDTVRTVWEMACPMCGEDDEIDIAATVNVRLTPDGSDADLSRDGWHLWDENSRATCACGFKGEVRDIVLHLPNDECQYSPMQGPLHDTTRAWKENPFGHGSKRPLDPRLDIADHSPDGFAWGYEGSGPAQLALALLCDAVGPGIARRHYQEFKRQVVATWPRDEPWAITAGEIRKWVRGHQEDDT